MTQANEPSSYVEVIVGAAMKIWLGALTFSVCIIGTAAAQSGYPNRPITLVVTSVPGGVTAVTGRAVAEELT